MGKCWVETSNVGCKPATIELLTGNREQTKKYMKKMKVSILALSVLAGGVLAASAANVTTYTPYSLDVTYTNAAAAVWEVDGAPATTSTAYPQVFSEVTAQTDGSGKITGWGEMYIAYNTNEVPYTVLWVSVTGKIGDKTAGAAAAVTLAIKGSGYSPDGKGGAVLASAALKFTGAVGTNPNTNGQKQIVVGTLSGNIKGATPLDPKNAKISSSTYPSLANMTVDSDYNFTDPQGSVLQAAKNGVPSSLQFFSSEATGKGTIKSGATYTVKFSGFGTEKGLSGTLTGSLGNYTNNIGTNPVVFLAPVSATLTAKDKGQAVSGTGPQSISASLQY
jgi:hypothetical protein